MTEGVFKDDDVLVFALGGAYSAMITVKIHKLHTNELYIFLNLFRTAIRSLLKK